MAKSLPVVRWGILGTGWVSKNFAKDLVLLRSDAKARHVLQAIGTSSTAKGKAFLDAVLPQSSTSSQPKIYTNYSDVYADPAVDVVYVATPHALHKANCLDAIAAGKHVLREKPFTINEDEAQEVITAAKKNGVFLMEAVWTRFFPIITDLKRLVHAEKIIGDVCRVFCDFSLAMDMPSLPATSRLKDPALGYLILDPNIGQRAISPLIQSSITVVDGIDHVDTIILNYPNNLSTAILTASLNSKTPDEFCRIEGSKGAIVISGRAASNHIKLVVSRLGEEEIVKDYSRPGMGFYYEADAVALDLAAGRTESEVMPLDETIRMMKTMDELRKAHGVRYPQDKW